MKNRWLKIALCLLGIALLAAGAGFLHSKAEKRWRARSDVSEAAQRNPMLAAARWLQIQGFRVATHDALTEALLRPLPPGTLVIAENHGAMTEAQAKQLIDWVSAGNTLIMSPKLLSVADDDEKSASADLSDDPIGDYLGVKLDYDAPDPTAPASEANAIPAEGGRAVGRKTVTVHLPGDYALEVAGPRHVLRSIDDEPAEVLFADKAAEVVRVYREGRGRIVFLASNPFTHFELIRHDHAELLLKLARLSAGRRVTLVQGLAMPHWYQAFASAFPLGLIGTAVCLLLVLWAAVRRFGPILPEPALERRALIEHIDASGRWLWSTPGGKHVLLEAARQTSRALIQRYLPELRRLDRQARLERLSERYRIGESALEQALDRPAAEQPADFTRQIQTLQQLRKHHER